MFVRLRAEFAHLLGCLGFEICGPKWGQPSLSSPFCLSEWSHGFLVSFLSIKASAPCGTDVSQPRRSRGDLQVPGRTAGMLLSCLFRCVSPLPSSKRFFFFFISKALPKSVLEGAVLAGRHEACYECPWHLLSACCFLSKSYLFFGPEENGLRYWLIDYIKCVC